MRRPSLVLVVWLTVVWVGLWGGVSAANVLGGLAIALALALLLPLKPTGSAVVVHPAAAARFAGRFAVDLCVSSAQVLVLALRPRLHLRQAIVAVRVPGASDELLTMLGNAISLTPGTLTVDVDQTTSTLYVHALDVGDGPDAVPRLKASLQEQARAATRALGSAHARTAATARRRTGGDGA